MGFRVTAGNSVLGYKLPAGKYKETGNLEEYRQIAMDKHTAIADDGGEPVPVPGDQDTFVPKLVKVYNYSDEVKEVMEVDYTGFGTSGGRKGNKSSEVSEEDRKRNLKRVKRNCRRLAFSNDLGQVHMVLTYKENMQDVDKSDEHFKKFMYLLRQEYPYIKYLATREFQQRGAVHYHILLNQRVNIKVVQQLWTHGFITLVQHKNQLKAVMYVLKYISKEVGNTVMKTAKGHTKKAYLSSKGLKQEVESCTTKMLINNSEAYLEFNDGLNFMMTNLTEGWDIPFNLEMPDGKVINGRSVLRCAASNY